jgi:hypothetical protein
MFFDHYMQAVKKGALHLQRPQGDIIFFSSFPGTIKYNKLSRKETQE